MAIAAGRDVSTMRLVAALRGNQEIPSEVRSIIADRLEGKPAKKRGRPVKDSIQDRIDREMIQHIYQTCYATILDEKSRGESETGAPIHLAFETTAAACSDLFFEKITPEAVKNIIHPSRPKKA
jgi:hypothetical protein